MTDPNKLLTHTHTRTHTFQTTTTKNKPQEKFVFHTDDGHVETVKSMWTSHEGGFLSLDGSCVYFCGVIDILIEYGQRCAVSGLGKV